MDNLSSADHVQATIFDHAALQAQLSERLDFYLSKSRKRVPSLEAAYDELTARIREKGAGVLVPAVGHRMPDFMLPDSQGALVKLQVYLERGPLVISFNRGPWCDYCGLELHALARAYPYIVAAGGEVVSIVSKLAPYARDLQDKRGLPFPVLADIDLIYAFSLGLVFWVGDKIKDMYLQFGIDLEQFHGNGGWLLPIPATFVVGRDGHVKARFADPDFRRRMNTGEVLAAVSDNAY